MHFYFTSAFPAVIKLNGIYYGNITDTVKSIKTDDDSTFIEVCSISNEFSSFSFILDKEFLTLPKGNVIVTDLNGGYLLKFIAKKQKDGFGVIKQQRKENFLATIFNDNGLRLTIETPTDFYAESISFDFNSVNISEYSEQDNFLIFYFTGEKNFLTIYKLAQKIQKVFEEQVDDFSTDGGLKTEKQYADILKHKVTCFYRYDGEKFITEQKQSTKKDKNLIEKIIPYAFCEEILVGGDITPFSTENILSKKDKLLEYMGDFIGVMPPPTFRTDSEIGLIYKKSENLFFVQYFTFSLIGGKIDNIKKM